MVSGARSTWKHQEEWQKKDHRDGSVSWSLGEQAVKITSVCSLSGHPDWDRKER